MPENHQKSAISPISYVYFTLFFISGISGLIYESIWSQYLKQFLGHAAYAQTLVLVIYMGGMAAGAWVAAGRVGKIRNLLLGYAVVEIALGALALVFHDLFIRYIDASFTVMIPALGKPLPIALYKWGTAALIILPQSMLLGATFPLMAGGILRRFPGLSGYKVSVIYFVNTLGASFGVLISGFYLVREWGLKGAIISGGVIDLFVGFSILALCLNDRSAVGVGVVGAKDIKDINDANVVDEVVGVVDGGKAGDQWSPLRSGLDADIDTDDIIDIDDIPKTAPSMQDRRDYYYPLFFVAAATAAASFIYEIGWIRMLSLVLGSSTHSFELMLSAFILGLALGSFFVRNKLDRIKNAPRFLGIVQVVMGAAALMTLFSYGGLFKIMVFAIDGLDRNPEGYVFFNIISHIICMLVMLPSTICAGMVIPLIIHILYARGYGEQAIGKVYAINTLGGIIGVVVAVWVLMELVGLKFLIAIGGAIDMGLGLYVLYRFAETRQSLTRTLAQPACVLALLAAVAFSDVSPVYASSGVFRYGSVSKAKRVVGHKDGKTATISLFKSGNSLVLSTNGKPDASVGMTEAFSSDEYTMSLLGVLPLSVREETRTAAVIGMGAGMTAHYMLYDPALERLDVVEIEPAMVRLAQKIGPKVENTFNDPRCHIHIEDAKTFFSAQNRTYDVIVSEPSNPWVSGVSSLFSREFFSHIRRHINPGGLLVQWFHIYEADITILVSILKALGEAFPDYGVYMVGSDLLILAARDEGTDIGVKRNVFAIPEIAENMGKMGFMGLDDLRLLRLAGKEFLGPLVNSWPTPPNSDYHSFVDLYAAKHRYMGSTVKELAEVMTFAVPVQKIIFADTGFLNLDPRRPVPDIFNLYEIQKAKALAQEVMASAIDIDISGGDGETGSASVFILDYASVRPEKISFVQVQSAIIQILKATLPYLSAGEMREMWGAIEMKLANWQFTESTERWMEYFRSLCGYDLPEMRRLSMELLPPGDTISGHFSNQMLMASLLASSAVLSDTTRVNRVWYRYAEKKDPPPSIRAVKAMLGL